MLRGWRNNRTERHCYKCDKWFAFTLTHWYINKRGYSGFRECRLCRNPSGRGPGAPKGVPHKMKFKHHSERVTQGTVTNAQTYRFGEIKLDPFAAVKAAQRLGLDLNAIKDWLNVDSDIQACFNSGGPMRPEKAAA